MVIFDLSDKLGKYAQHTWMATRDPSGNPFNINL